jgi:hypothetical protein
VPPPPQEAEQVRVDAIAERQVDGEHVERGRVRELVRRPQCPVGVRSDAAEAALQNKDFL